MTQTNKVLKKRRNVWSSEEVLFLLDLIKEKYILGLMDGKRLRVADIFKTLVAPMEEAGFHRDVSQMTIKWKNLKAEYYKCKRHNGVSGNDPAEFEFYKSLEDILGHRPSTQTEGFDTSQTLEVTMGELLDIEESDDRVEMYEDAPDADGAIPGASTTPGIQRLVGAASRAGSSASSSSKSSGRTKVSKNIEIILNTGDEIKASLVAETEKEKAADQDFLDKFFIKQEAMMLKCTQLIIQGLQDIFNPSKSKPNREDEESDVEEDD